MIDVINIGKRLDGYVVVDSLARAGLDRYFPLASFGAQQDDLSRLFVMHDQCVRICDHSYRRSFSGADIADYVALPRVQSERHFRWRAVGGEDRTRPKNQNTDGGNQPRKQSTSSFSFHLLPQLAFFPAYGMSIVFGVGT